MKQLICAIFILVFMPSLLMADSEALPYDQKTISSSGEYSFVMLVPSNEFIKDNILRRKYKKSGLYRNDGSSEPLWTVDWYSFEVYLSSDGDHIVRMGPWPRLLNNRDLEKGRPALKQLGVAFYNKGILLKSYSIEDLIDDPKKLPQTVSHFQWRKKTFFDEKSGKLNIITYEGKEFIFDIYSGEIIKRSF